MRTDARDIVIINPIPMALGEYCTSLAGVLRELGFRVEVLVVSGAERHSLGKWRRLRSAIGFARLSMAIRRSTARIIIAWPLLGYFDVAWWGMLIRKEPVYVIVHDVPSMRREFRSSLRLWHIIKRMPFSNVAILTHSASSLQLLKCQRAMLVQHPINLDYSRRSPRTPRNSLLVAGQYKITRDVEAMTRLGQRDHGIDLRLVGSGWPRIPGWNVVDRFVSELELDEQILSSGAVLMSYTRYSQSGVAIRALQCAVPVIGVAHAQLRYLYGDNYPGIVDCLSPDEVVGAYRRVQELPEEFYKYRLTKVREGVLESWSELNRDLR